MKVIVYSVSGEADEAADALAEAGLFGDAVGSGHDPVESEVRVYARWDDAETAANGSVVVGSASGGVADTAADTAADTVADRVADRVVGVCGGQILWGDLYIDMMWVRPELRGKGIGAALLQHAEDEAQRRGCFCVHLFTMSFQAPDFYPRFGYREFARLGGYPHGAERIFYIKQLGSPDK